MKRFKTLAVFYVLVTLFSVFNLWGVTYNISIKKNEFNTDKNHTIPVLQENQYIDFQPGNPLIPVQTYWFLLESNQRISDANIKILSTYNKTLELPLLPVQYQTPLSSESEVKKLTEYNSASYPENILYRFGNGFSGNKNIGFVSFYTGMYNTYDIGIHRL